MAAAPAENMEAGSEGSAAAAAATATAAATAAVPMPPTPIDPAGFIIAPAAASLRAWFAAARAAITRWWAAAAAIIAPVGIWHDPTRCSEAFLMARRVEVMEKSELVTTSMHTRKTVDGTGSEPRAVVTWSERGKKSKRGHVGKCVGERERVWREARASGGRGPNHYARSRVHMAAETAVETADA